MSVLEKIKGWVSEGLDDSDVAYKFFELDEAKNFTSSQVADAILKAKNSQEVQEKLLEAKKTKDALEAKAKQDEDFEKKLSEKMDEKLKSINLNFGQYKVSSPEKRFNVLTGKYEEITQKQSDAYNMFNKFIACLGNKDFSGAKSISDEIEQDNEQKLSQFGIKSTSVSDVASRGGYTVPVEVDAMILQMAYSMCQVYQLTQKYVVNYNSYVVPTMGNFSVQWLADQSTTITDNNPTFYNPTLDIKRCAIGTKVSNEFLAQKGMDLVNSFVQGMASAFARELDKMIISGSITGNSDLFNGLVFDSNTLKPTAYALTAITEQKILDLINSLSDDATDTLRIIGNRNVISKIGMLENGAGYRIYPDFSKQGANGLTPFGVQSIMNPKIPSTFDVGAGKRTTGTDDVLIVADLNKVATAVSEQTRIAMSTDADFFGDNFAIKAIKKYAQKVLVGSGALGVVCVAQELTNA